MKHASVYSRHDGWFLHAFSTTTVGLSVGSTPYIKLDIHASESELGEAVLKALEGTKENVPHPTREEWKKRWPILDLAGVKTWDTFAKNASSVDVNIEGECLIFEPWKNAGPELGFVQFEAEKIAVPASAPVEQIGEALKKVMALAPSSP